MTMVKDITWRIVYWELQNGHMKNRLKLNHEKTEFIVFASKRQRHKVPQWILA